MYFCRLPLRYLLYAFAAGPGFGWFYPNPYHLPNNRQNGIPSKKLKAPKGYIIKNERDSDAVIATFLEQQEKLLLLLHQARRINLNKIKIPISIAKYIRLKLGDVFMFIIAHNIRHIRQAERAIAVAQTFSSENEAFSQSVPASTS